MHCYNCGKKLGKGRFCPHCGTPVSDAPGPLRPRERPVIPGRPSMTVSVGVLIACLILLIGGGVVAYAVMGKPLPGASTREQPSPSTSLSWLAAGALESTTTTEPATTAPAPATSTTSTTAGPTTTSSTLFPPDAAVYADAVTELAVTLADHRDRLPRLSATIGAESPDVSQPIFDELNQMVAESASLRADLSRTETPEGFEDLTRALDRAARYMHECSQDILAGIETMGRTGREASANSRFADANRAADRFRAAFAEFEELVAEL